MANKFTIGTTFKAHDRMTSTVKKMSKVTSGFSKTLSVLKVAIAGGIAFKGVQFLVKEASKIEDAAAAFTPLMGGVGKATELVARLNETAATTPFQFENIAKAVAQLLPEMNQDIEKTIETFRMLGDTAGGNVQKLDSITRGFTRALLVGKPNMEALNMIAEAGVPIFSEMAKSMGISKEKLFEMSKAGKLTTKHLTQVFKDMTSEGGIFFRGMAISSETLTGRLSTLRDNINNVAGTLGKNLLPLLKPIIDKLIKIAGQAREWIENNKEMINQRVQDVFKKISKTVSDIWGALKKLNPFLEAALDVFNALKYVLPFVAVGMVALTIAQWNLNAALAANPVGGAVAALWAMVAVAIVIVRFWEEITTALRNAWNWINKIFNNPIIKAGLAIFASGLWLILATIQSIVDLLSGRGLVDAFANFAGPFKGLLDALGITQAGGRWAGRAGAGVLEESGQREEQRLQAGAMLANAPYSSRHLEEFHTYVEIGLAPGLTAKQKGNAPYVDIPLGFSGGSLAGARR